MKPVVLIVDDDVISRHLIANALGSDEYELVHAGDGEDALRQAARVAPDVVLLDIMMPRMDGYEVCRRLRNDPNLREVPVVMATALEDHDSRIKGVDAGADDFLTKPLDTVLLRSRVRMITRLDRFSRLREEHRRFDWIVEHAVDGYVVVDNDGRIRYANPAGRRLLMARDEEIDAGPDFLELAHKQFNCFPETSWLNWPQLPQSPAAQFLVRPETPDSGSLWLLVEYLPMASRAAPSATLHLRDITVEQALAAGSSFLHASVAHKFRTPLNAVIGGLDLIVNDLAGLPPEVVRETLDDAYLSAQRLHEQVEDILKHLESTTGIWVGSCRVQDITALVAGLCRSITIAPASTMIATTVRDRYLPINRAAAEQILREVLENCRKFHPEHMPTVTIRVTSPGDGKIRISISDDGAHIPAAQMERVWLPGFQAEKLWTGEVPGMGLGLPLVANITWSVGGAVTIHNRSDGPGVDVELTFPEAPANRAET